MKRIFFLFCAVCAMQAAAYAQNEARLLRFPAVHGDRLVFTYGGDLYTASLAGGEARKLTNAVGYECFARYSPDGKLIAFTGNYDGNTEVYVMPADGGSPTRLTYTATLGRDDISDRMGPNNIVMGWTPDGKNIVYRSRKQTFNDFVGQLFTVPVTGGLSSELPLPEGGWCSYSSDGSKLAYNRVMREFRTWKRYRGGMADDVWIYDFKTKALQNVTNNVAQDVFPIWIGNRIFFASDRDHTMNLFVWDAATQKTTKVTDYNDYDVKFPSADDKGIVYENGGYIYYMDAATMQSRKVSIRINGDAIQARSRRQDVSGNIASADIAPDGKRIVVGAHGDVFTVPAKSGITRNLTHSSNANDRSVAWSPDGKWIAYISDLSGEFEIYIQKQDGSEPAQAVTKNADTYKFDISWSPDSRKIMWSDKMMRLQYVDITTKAVTLVSQSPIWEFHSYNWSPDSRWICYSESALNRFGQVWLYDTKSGSKTAVTDRWFQSGSPVFSSDGKYLFFTSDRHFEPTYSATEWNAAYRNMGGLYAVTLAADTPSPFAPQNDETAVKDDDTKPATAKADAKKGDAKKSDAKKGKDASEEKAKDAVVVKIDTTGLRDRVFALPVPAGGYYGLATAGKHLYYLRGGTLYCYDVEKKKESEVGHIRGYAFSPDGKKMLAISNGYRVIDTPTGKAHLDDEAIDLSNLTIDIDKRVEWKQIFDEAWRQMRDFYYASNMNGVDWKAMHDRYAVLLPYAETKDDVNYLIGEMIGELNGGHCYINGGERELPRRIPMGLLGVQVSKDPTSGFFRIDRILEGANWDKSLRSPLTETNVNAKVGEYITAINGQSLAAEPDLYRLLVGTADKEVELQLNSKPTQQGSRKALVIPVGSEASLYYYNWVQGNIRKVEKATNGQVGYIHIPDMSSEGLNEFVKYFYPQLDKKALIIDDRGNGGGNVSPIILERLLRKVQRSNVSRNQTIPSQTPNAMHLGPKVLLMNRYSASDGDLFPYGFQKYGIGKVIGTRSWGGVIGIRGSLPFVDGTDLRKPEYGTYSADKSEWIIEGHGVDPDIVIDNDPAREYAGIDDQLNKAIEVILEELKDYKGLPAIPEPPDKSR